MENSKKSRAIALLLSGLIGGLGVHRFYVGKNGTGLIMLFLTLTIIGVWISGFWNLVDFILILSGRFRDSKNQTLKDW
jgi:TM2 domain-containing membrane protein YozV